MGAGILAAQVGMRNENLQVAFFNDGEADEVAPGTAGAAPHVGKYGIGRRWSNPFGGTFWDPRTFPDESSSKGLLYYLYDYIDA